MRPYARALQKRSKSQPPPGEPHGFSSSADNDVGAIIELAFGELDLHRLEAATLVDHVVSRRVLEKKGRHL